MKKRQFKAESKRLLDLMINSIYTHKEIFLREIISNASDAIDKLYYQSLTDSSVGLNRDDFGIRIIPDKTARTLTVSDNGIGMNAEELEANLGVIAASGSRRFKEENEKPEGEESSLIGQFGVGFYSAFMVSDRITVISRKFGDEQAWKWESEGAEGYTVTEAERASAGTDVIMHLREDNEEEKEDYSRFLDEYTLRDLVKKYSDYIRFPIRMDMPKSRRKEGTPDDKPEWESYTETETLNSMIPLWQRKKTEVTKEEYDNFYRARFGGFTPPQSVITLAAEGAVTFKALLFIPAEPPVQYRTTEYKPGLQLYSNGVLIMERCEELLPPQFDFVRGVVDSPDLSLNISREMLQHDRQLKRIGQNLEKKIRSELLKMLKDDREGYEKFYMNFGRQLKYGAMDLDREKKEQLEELLLFYSSHEKKLTTLEEYASRMPEEQKYIYYATGENVDAIDRLPQTELVRDHRMEILYFTEPGDDFLANIFMTYKEKPFRSIIDEDPELEDAPKADTEEVYRDSFAFIKETLGDRVSEVKASSRLKNHPVCLASGAGVTFEMEKYMAAVRPDLNMKAQRILEINVNHPAFTAFDKARTEDPEKAKKYAEILYQQAVLIAGLPLEDPTEYTDLLCSLW